MPLVHTIVGSALAVYPEPTFETLMALTPPPALTEQVPANPLPWHPATPLQSAMADAPSTYPLPAVVMTTAVIPGPSQMICGGADAEYFDPDLETLT